MLLIIRFLLILIYSFLVCFFGIIYCLINPRKITHVFNFCKLFSYILTILGLKVKIINYIKNIKKYKNVIYIANHQSYFDILAVANIMKPNIVTIGKKSLLYVPFFGLLYWLAGNFTVNRTNVKKANHDLRKIIYSTQKKKILFGFFQKVKEI